MENSLDLFDVSKFNIVEDEENYYFFQALEYEDSIDYENEADKSSKRIRVDRKRYEENPKTGEPKYKAEDVISLEEVYDHIKMGYRMDTNCISLTSNANVVIDYGKRTFYERYVAIRIPKKEMGQNVVNAGQYMLREIEKKVAESVRRLEPGIDDEIIEQIRKIDEARTIEEINEIVQNLYGKIKPETKRYRGRKEKVRSKTSVIKRISRYQALDEEQNIEKNRIIGKLTVLEINKKMPSLIPHTKTNTIEKTN